MPIEKASQLLLHFLAHTEIGEGLEHRLLGIDRHENSFPGWRTLAHRRDDPIAFHKRCCTLTFLLSATFVGIHPPDFFDDDQGRIAAGTIHRRHGFPDAVDPRSDGDTLGGVVEQNAVGSELHGLGQNR